MSNFDNLFLQAYNFFKENMFDLAVSKLNDAEINHSTFEQNDFSLEDLFILRGTIYLTTNQLENAKVNFESALNINPNSSEACLGLGQYFFANGQLESAKVMFEWAVKYDQGHPGAKKALENINMTLGHTLNHSSLEDSQVEPSQAQKFGPLDEAAQLFSEKKYGETLIKLVSARKEQEEILGSIENFIAFNYLELNDTDNARNAAERALRLNPFSSQAYATLGEINYRHGNYQEAKKMYEIALQHNTENTYAKTGLQNTLNSMGLNNSQVKANNHSFIQY